MPEALEISVGSTRFEGILPISSFMPPGGPCVYVILFKPKPKEAPMDFKMLYFGEHEDLSSPDFYAQNPKLRCWISEGGRLDALYVGYCQMPDASLAERKQKVLDLLEVFRPICNV